MTAIGVNSYHANLFDVSRGHELRRSFEVPLLRPGSGVLTRNEPLRGRTIPVYWDRVHISADSICPVITWTYGSKGLFGAD